MNTKSIAKFGRPVTLAAVLGAACFFITTPQARAEDGRSCRWQVQRAEARLSDAIYRHGEYSREANERRRDLYFERNRCWNLNQSYWYGDRWRNDHDRDDRYYDRDRDRDRGHDRDRDRRDRDDRYRDHDGR